MKNLAKLGLGVPKILLPSEDIPISKWAVIACDQYTQDRDYWRKAAVCAEGGPSSLNLILPEVFLGDDDKAERIGRVHSAMRDYRRQGVFRSPVEGFVYLERSTAYGRTRRGLIAAVDLESYEWRPDTSAPVRATEATIPERIPPRMEIRRGAELELPHIMLLANDPKHRLVGRTGAAAKAGSKPLYDGDLMLGAGRVAGWAVQGELLAQTEMTLAQLALENTCADGSVFLFAVGDGNHSLATAKAVWDEHKAAQLNAGRNAEEIKGSALRHALVEIVNIYDEGLTFEPIHRVLFNTDAERLIGFCRDRLGGTVTECASDRETEHLVANSKAAFGFAFKGKDGKDRRICLDTPVAELAVSRLQPLLDEFLSTAPGAEIDYIHGADEVFRLAERSAAVTVLLPPIAKDSFFATIADNGPLPIKSFSLGEASEKRFYLEARSIV